MITARSVRNLFSPPFSPASPYRLPILLACILFLLLPGCSNDTDGNGKNGQKKRSSIPVTLEVSRKETLPLEIGATGHIEAFATVGIRSQVTGTLQSVHFKEGEEVKAGELLFTIDPRPFAAGLAKVEAELAKDKADLDNARREGNRYALAVQKGLVSTEQANQAATRVATLTATVKADQAMVENARLELAYCTIRAPFAGRTGEIQTDQGNLIKANADTPMVTINQVQPILAAFTVPGLHLKDIKKYRAAGTLQVVIADPSATDEPLTGSLSFIDNTVDPTTGVIRLKARFANTGTLLWPGQMVDIQLRLTSLPDCIVVPSQAVQIGQKGSYVYVVRDDQTVEYRPVTPGMFADNNTMITAGLQAGERVVTDGQMQLADGVTIKERGRPAAVSSGDQGKKSGRARGNQ